MKPDERLNKAVLDVVENQIRQLNPPTTKETFDRLIREGYDHDEARRLIGCVVASEIFDILRTWNRTMRTDMWPLFGDFPNCPNNTEQRLGAVGAHNTSLDRSGGCVLCIMIGPARLE